ncbi:MAG: lipid-A-disaccharide synthase [Acidobacteriota bacterium]
MADNFKKIMIVAGEASGDLHSAKLVSAFQELEPDQVFEFFGAAGPEMRKAGVRPVVESDSISIVGLPEILRALPMFINIFRRLIAAADTGRPEAVVLVDFPDFNLRLARALKRRGHRVIYYISPQIWAWRKYRINILEKYVDLIISILPFEKSWYMQNGVKHVEYVGNPLVSEVKPSCNRAEFCDRHGLDSRRPVITLLPGSRSAEISRIAPILAAAAEQMRRDQPDLQFVFAVKEGKGQFVREVIGLENQGFIKVVEGETYDALAASDVAAVTSGTATLEAALLGVPSVIVYRASKINYTLLRPLINVEHFGLINLIAGKRIVKELIQGDFTPLAVAEEINRLLNPDIASKVKSQITEAVSLLGSGGASRRAAEAILTLIRKGSG